MYICMYIYEQLEGISTYLHTCTHTSQGCRDWPLEGRKALLVKICMQCMDCASDSDSAIDAIDSLPPGLCVCMCVCVCVLFARYVCNVWIVQATQIQQSVQLIHCLQVCMYACVCVYIYTYICDTHIVSLPPGLYVCAFLSLTHAYMHTHTHNAENAILTFALRLLASSQPSPAYSKRVLCSITASSLLPDHAYTSWRGTAGRPRYKLCISVHTCMHTNKCKRIHIMEKLSGQM